MVDRRTNLRADTVGSLLRPAAVHAARADYSAGKIDAAARHNIEDAAIRDEIRARTGRAVTPGAVYPTLDRLEAKGYVRSYLGDPQPVRGGRARRHFDLKPAGRAEARRAWRQLATLAADLEPSFEGPGR